MNFDFIGVSYTILLPIITFIGIVTNTIAVVIYTVLIGNRTKIQNFNLVCCVLHLTYLVILIAVDVLKAPVYYELEYKEVSKYIQLIFDDYLTSSLAVLIIYVQIYTFTQHYLLISNKRKLFITDNIRYYTI